MKTDREGKLVVVTGPSGVGKSTIISAARSRTDAAYSVSVTTRRPRPGEVDGEDYRFIDRESFDRMKDDGALLEWAEVFGNCYGTPKLPVQEAIEQGGVIILEIDIQGGMQVHAQLPDETFVLILPPGKEALRKRLHFRGTEDEVTLRQRLKKSEEEIRMARDSGIYTHEIVNNDVETAVDRLVEIILE